MPAQDWSALSPDAEMVLARLLHLHRGKQSFGGSGLDWESVLGPFMSDIDEFRVMAVLLLQASCLTPAGAQGLLEYAWSTENSPQARVPKGVWLEIFSLVGYSTEIENPIDAPLTVLTLYRGCRRTTRCDLAWTEVESKANEFAAEVNGEVFQANVAPAQVLARYNRSGERECVVDTRGLAMTSVDGRALDPCSSSGTS